MVGGWPFLDPLHAQAACLTLGYLMFPTCLCGSTCHTVQLGPNPQTTPGPRSSWELMYQISQPEIGLGERFKPAGLLLLESCTGPRSSH